MWFVKPQKEIDKSGKHEKSYQEARNEENTNVTMKQIVQDGRLSDGSVIDVNLMDEEAFLEYTGGKEKGGLIDIVKDTWGFMEDVVEETKDLLVDFLGKENNNYENSVNAFKNGMKDLEKTYNSQEVNNKNNIKDKEIGE